MTDSVTYYIQIPAWVAYILTFSLFAYVIIEAWASWQTRRLRKSKERLVATLDLQEKALVDNTRMSHRVWQLANIDVVKGCECSACCSIRARKARIRAAERDAERDAEGSHD